MRRRQIMTASAIGIAALAGCLGDDDDESENGDTDETGDDGGTDDPGEASIAVVEAFYDAVDDADLETANGYYHSEFDEELSEEDYEEFGGIESMDYTIEDTRVVDERDDFVEVHADADVSTPIGSETVEEWFLVAPDGDEHRILMYLPEPIRDELSEEEIDGAMRR